MANGSFPEATIRPSACRTWKPPGRSGFCAGTRSASAAWPCRPMANGSSPQAGTTRSRCGTWKRSWRLVVRRPQRDEVHSLPNVVTRGIGKAMNSTLLRENVRNIIVQLTSGNQVREGMQKELMKQLTKGSAVGRFRTFQKVRKLSNIMRCIRHVEKEFLQHVRISRMVLAFPFGGVDFS